MGGLGGWVWWDGLGWLGLGGWVSFFWYLSTLNNESLVNTLSNSDLSNNLPTTTSQLIDVAVQTDTNIQVETSIQTTYVNTGMQTSARMWLESISNWITEILGTTPNAQYVDAGVQTMAPTTSMWSTVKQWFLEVCSVRGSELASMGKTKVDKWRNNLDSVQSVELHNSESPLSTLGSNSSLHQLIVPDDSASNISAVTDILTSTAINYTDTILDPTVLAVWMNVSPLGV